MPLSVLASKASEGRGDHAAHIFSHEEYDAVVFSFFLLEAY